MAGTLEQAARCPKCDEAGDIGSRMHSNQPGIDVIGITCRNEACSWYETGWIVTVNPDGSIPDPAPVGTVRGEKQFGAGELLKAGITTETIRKVNEGIDRLNQRTEI